MSFFIFKPVLKAAHVEDKELLRKFMCLGDSFEACLELGAVKIRSLQMDEQDAVLADMVSTVEVERIDERYDAVMQTLVNRYGWDLDPENPAEKKTASMIACLLAARSFDVLEQIALTKPLSLNELIGAVA